MKDYTDKIVKPECPFDLVSTPLEYVKWMYFRGRINSHDAIHLIMDMFKCSTSGAERLTGIRFNG